MNRALYIMYPTEKTLKRDGVVPSLGPIPQRSRSQLLTVLAIRRVRKNCRASTFLRSRLYFLLVEMLGAREEEESWSDDQEQEDIDGAGEVEH